MIESLQAPTQWSKSRGVGRVVAALLLSLLSLVLAWSPPAASDVAEGVPGVKPGPFVGKRVEYESNVIQAPSRPQGDVIFKTIQGILP